MIIKPIDFNSPEIVKAINDLRFCMYDFSFAASLMTNPAEAVKKYERNISTLLDKWSIDDWKETFSFWADNPNLAPEIILGIVNELKMEARTAFGMLIANWDSIQNVLLDVSKIVVSKTQVVPE